MMYEEFLERVSAVLQPERQFLNPGGGVSTVKSLVSGHGRETLYYIRGRSTIQFSLRDMYDGFMAFRGKTCATADLKGFRPAVFNSKAKGHDCNCTLLFLALREVQLTGPIEGSGVKGSPFRITIA